MLAFVGLFVYKLIHWIARNDRDVAPEQSDEAESRLSLVFAGNDRPPKASDCMERHLASLLANVPFLNTPLIRTDAFSLTIKKIICYIFIIINGGSRNESVSTI